MPKKKKGKGPSKHSGTKLYDHRRNMKKVGKK